MALGSTNTDRQLVQDNRVAKLFTPLPKTARGDDMLAFERIEASEGMSELFEYRVDALSTERDVDFTNALGRNCCVSVNTYNGAVRYFHGVLTEAQWMGGKGEFYSYRLTLRPWLWLLGREADCRIFKNMTILDIAKKVFQEAGFGDDVLKVDIQQDLVPFEYCVQYRETDLAFVSRLMEEYGIYTFFTHSLDKHVLHLSDWKGGHEPISIPQPPPFETASSRDLQNRIAGKVQASDGTPMSAEIQYIPLAGSDQRFRQHVYQWLAERRLRTGKIELRDYDYNKAKTKLVGDKQSIETYAKHDREAYDYPGRFTVTGTGTQLANVRLEAEQALDHRKFAAGDAPSLFPGALFKLTDHATDNGEYIVVRATHSLAVELFRSGSGSGGGSNYHGHYEFQEKARPFRAPQITPKPRVYGPQTAVVVTKVAGSSEEIDVDEQGRIWVNFHWNRGKPNEDCSRPVRVAQMWAGPSWGWQVIPRVGMEVVVEFLEGDPDQPLVTGTVYNSTNQYPYPMPAQKNISGVKTDSTKGHNGFNELYFDDTKGSEKIKVKAEKDRETVVQDTETRQIWNWQTEEIGKNYKKGDADSRKTTIFHGSDELLVQDGKWLQTIEKDWVTHVTSGDVKMTVHAGSQIEEISKGGYEMNVKKESMRIQVDQGNYVQQITNGNWQLKTGQAVKVKAGSNVGVSAAQSIHIKAGMTLVIEAGVQISLKVGGNFIDIGPAGVAISGTMVMINSGGAPGSGNNDFE